MKPLLLIDVDGPLNPYDALADARPPRGYTRHVMRPAAWPYPQPLSVLLNPGHGAELLALADRYELVWATTWEGDANEWIGPRLGLPELPYIGWPETHGKAPRGTFWKTRYVLEYAAGRPFAWIDDEITSYDREWVEREHLAAALLLRVDPGIGLTRPDFDALARWATAL
ncbi:MULTISPECIES: HAD domain-containing protein [unclassified Streptomyces]|uniref:HAD domain-containing protein n=1 Tax=unclassified Streptomyces TaxID=2593676 RepID=UPI0038163712